MLLAAELDRLSGEASASIKHRADAAGDDHPATTAAADSIYYRVEDAGLYRIARAAGMQGFAVSGYWANAQITAADMARLFARLDTVMAGPEREFALGLLGSVIPEQSWGVSEAAGERWAVRFKGGWRETERGSLVHQAAELRRDGRSLAIAVLTDGQPSRLCDQDRAGRRAPSAGGRSARAVPCRLGLRSSHLALIFPGACPA